MPNSGAGVLATLSEKLIRALPPAFLLLVILNIAFLGSSMYVFSHNTAVRNELLTEIVKDCLLRNQEK